MNAGITPQVLVLIGLAVWCGACALYTARAWPIDVRRRVAHLTERVLAAEASVESLESKWTAKTVELAAFLEEAEGVLESVERKRRRAAASAASANGHSESTDESADPYLALARRARAAGHPV